MNSRSYLLLLLFIAISVSACGGKKTLDEDYNEDEIFSEEGDADAIPAEDDFADLGLDDAFSGEDPTVDGPTADAPTVEGPTNEISPPIGVSSPGTHTVKAGETLSTIAYSYYGNISQWKDLADINRDSISDPHSIFIGLNLKLVSGAHYSEERANRKFNTSNWNSGNTMEDPYASSNEPPIELAPPIIEKKEPVQEVANQQVVPEPVAAPVAAPVKAPPIEKPLERQISNSPPPQEKEMGIVDMLKQNKNVLLMLILGIGGAVFIHRRFRSV